MALKALHAKTWPQNKYTELAPSTRKAIKGMIVVAKMAAGAIV
jgi:hypothetical protein